MYQNLVSWACPKFIFTPKSYQFNNNNIKLALQISIGNKSNFQTLSSQGLFETIPQIYTPNVYNEHPCHFYRGVPHAPQDVYRPFQSCPKHLFQREAKSDAIDIKKCFFIPMQTKFSLERLCT